MPDRGFSLFTSTFPPLNGWCIADDAITFTAFGGHSYDQDCGSVCSMRQGEFYRSHFDLVMMSKQRVLIPSSVLLMPLLWCTPYRSEANGKHIGLPVREVLYARTSILTTLRVSLVIVVMSLTYSLRINTILFKGTATPKHTEGMRSKITEKMIWWIII